MTEHLLAEVEAAAGFAVHGAPAAASRRELVARGVPGLLAGKDPTLWGPAAEDRALARLGFLDAYRYAGELLPLIAELHEELGDLRHVVLIGSGLAAGAVARTLGRPLTVLDEPDPHRARALLDDAELLRRTVVVVADASLAGVFWQAYRDLGLSAAEAGRHFVVLGDPPPALEAAGAVTVPTGTGALSAATLVPAALAGADVAELIDEAELFAPSLAGSEENPALALGLALAAADRVLLVADGSGLEGLGEWAADVITGGLGIPVIAAESPQEAGPAAADTLTVTIGGSLSPVAVPGAGVHPAVAVNGPLGAHFSPGRTRSRWRRTCAGWTRSGNTGTRRPARRAEHRLSSRARWRSSPLAVPRISPRRCASCSPRGTISSTSGPSWTGSATPRSPGCGRCWPLRPAARSASAGAGITRPALDAGRFCRSQGRSPAMCRGRERTRRSAAGRLRGPPTTGGP